MQKLYKYRPNSDFLFKELLYNELYFASYNELNDPLDLSVRIDFRPNSEDEIDSLLYLILKSNTIHSFKTDNESLERKHCSGLVEFYKNKEAKTKFKKRLFECLNTNQSKDDFISFDIIAEEINKISPDFGIVFNTEQFGNELKRLSKIFFEKSYTTCFTETYSDFLMWSHYASKHTGICLEFSLEHDNNFPYISNHNRALDHEKILDDYASWDLTATSCWDKIWKVEYRDNAPTINFYRFSPVFANEHDCDLIGLSKSKWHGFAHELEKVFSFKTIPWKYEKEWRAIEINFGRQLIPEERIRQYPIEILTGVYFGMRTSESVKSRIYLLLNSKNKEIKYYEAHLTNERDLEFEEWEYYEE